ncbi:hypothetical protein [Parasphingopyxis sp.]|uniref:hypothetical protein n=1 Tax=Parasphingopyxis sp. TaxID=1920299 RepID=UPI00261037CF|nr:hypothetical protein [Parasphingopyxis sp.]
MSDSLDENLMLWDALGKSDPAHTKPFTRPGGFKGTSLKPIWIIKKMTEQFGPCGQGWGIGEPRFEMVHCEKESLVYCTASIWHGDRENIVYGVGGDKVRSQRTGNDFCDDEAFKKAFTDAVNNALKFLGIGADIHMGQHDDDKYVEQMRAEFGADEKKPVERPQKISPAQLNEITVLIDAAPGVTSQDVVNMLRKADPEANAVTDMVATDFEKAKRWIAKQAKENA